MDDRNDVQTFHRIQNRISQFADITEEDELLWHRNNVNSSALYEFLRTEGHRYDRIIMGPYPRSNDPLIFRCHLH